MKVWFRPVAAVVALILPIVLIGPLRAGGQVPDPGARPFAVLLCRYPDIQETFGFDAARIQQMWVGDRSIDSLVRETSLGTASLAGTQTFGWFTVRTPLAGYSADFAGNLQLMQDCIDAARPTVDLSRFMYAAIFMNDQTPLNGGFAPSIDFGGRAGRRRRRATQRCSTTAR
ncbi:MAG: hypothetical protein R2713_22685 [Ilumatobacteraceae bacterium]